MEITNRFGKGLHTDFDPQDQPGETYRNGVNLVREVSGTITPEPGSVVTTHLPEGMLVIGSGILNNDLILFLCDINEQYSEIGIAPSGEQYRSIMTNLPSPFNTPATVILTDNELGFKLSNPIRCECRVDYRFHKLVYFIDGAHPARMIDLNKPATTVEGLSSFLTSVMPDVKVRSVSEDGSLPTGIYQFAVRLLTSSGNKTTASIITEPIPIGDGQRSASANQYDGAPPQTASNKAINLDVTRIDDKYKFIELIAITYTGVSNQFTANVVETKSITGPTTAFKYSTATSNKEQVELLEVTVDPVSYEVPKTIAQKDGRLLYGNVQSRKFDPNFQAVANEVILKYTIKELKHNQTVNVQTGRYGNDGRDLGSSPEYDNYKDPLNSANYRGYLRDEVYSFALVPLFRDFSFGYAYHIPGFHTWQQDADTGSKYLGTFMSQDHDYPPGFGFPQGKVRYHRMPNMGQENIFDYNTQKIRVLGVEAVNIDLTKLSAQDRKNIIGFALVRELRTEENKSILAQGIMNTMMSGINEQGGVDDAWMQPSPWTGKDDWCGNIMNMMYDNEGAFYSPETTILGKSMSGATHLRQVASMTGTNYLVGERRANGYPIAHIFQNYNWVWPHQSTEAKFGRVAINSSATTTVRANSGDVSVIGSQSVIKSNQTNGFVYMKTLEDRKPLPLWENEQTRDRKQNRPEIDYDIVYNGTDTIYFHWPDGSDVVADQDDTDYRGFSLRALINAIADRPNQYGPVLDKQYIMIGYKLIDQDIESITCYGGDTYINKVGILIGCINEINDKFEFNTMSYFWCESGLNTAYRHHSIINGVPQTLPYYPATQEFCTAAKDGLLQISLQWGHANGYNRQYDFENDLKKFISKPLLLEEEVTNFSNRILYSEQSVEGEQFDAYRTFLENSYHDVPKHKGEITDLFVHGGSLYIHTAKTLFKALMNEQTTLASSSGEMVLGNGGLFPMPAKEIFTINGGYAGTVSPLASCNTAFGRIFIDNHQGKVFLLGEGLSEISSQGMSKWFRSNVTTDNPLDYRSAYDYRLKRWILTTPGGTISYSTHLQSWSSFHTYRPNHMLSLNDQVFMTKLGLAELHLLRAEVLPSEHPCTYFDDQTESMILGVVANTSVLETKSFDDLVLLTSTKTGEQTRPWQTFSRMRAWNRIQNTGERTIFVPRSFTQNIRATNLQEVKANLKNNEYRIAMPQDLVIDPSGDINVSTNLTTNGAFRPRMKGKHVEIEFYYDKAPEDWTEFKVYAITTTIRPVSG